MLYSCQQSRDHFSKEAIIVPVRCLNKGEEPTTIRSKRERKRPQVQHQSILYGNLAEIIAEEKRMGWQYPYLLYYGTTL